MISGRQNGFNKTDDAMKIFGSKLRIFAYNYNICIHIYIHIIGFNKTDDMTQLKSLVPNGNIYILMC